jgi:hypothetical protein
MAPVDPTSPPSNHSPVRWKSWNPQDARAVQCRRLTFLRHLSGLRWKSWNPQDARAVQCRRLTFLRHLSGLSPQGRPDGPDHRLHCRCPRGIPVPTTYRVVTTRPAQPATTCTSKTLPACSRSFGRSACDMHQPVRSPRDPDCMNTTRRAIILLAPAEDPSRSPPVRTRPARRSPNLLSRRWTDAVGLIFSLDGLTLRSYPPSPHADSDLTRAT